MKFNLKLFVLVGVLAGFRDVCGTEKVKNKDYGGFIVAGFEGNEELKAAMGGNRVIKAVYKTVDGGEVGLINRRFKNKLSSIFVWDGKVGKIVAVKELSISFSNLYYNMKPGVEYTVYFIFDGDGVESTANMFFVCSRLIRADFRYFNTSNVTDMSSMFYNCLALKELNLNNFTTTNVTDMSYMFAACIALTKLNLSAFDTTNVKDMSYMFYNCTALKNLDLRNFYFSHACKMKNVSQECNFDKLYLSKKYEGIRERCCCCGYVYINDKKVASLNPNNVEFVEGVAG